LLRDEISDPVDIDILANLIETPDCRKRSRDIEKELVNKYSKSYNENSFHTHFNRCIKRLCNKELIEREPLDHQQVFYAIPERLREKIRIDLQKIKNTKIFTQLELEEQQKLISEVNLLRKRELTRNLMDMPLPGYAIISKCQEMNLNYEDFEPNTWGNRVVMGTEETYIQTVPFSRDSDLENREIELMIIPQTDLDTIKAEKMAYQGWKLLGISSRKKLALCGRLEALAQSIENTVEAYIEYLKIFYPPEKWAQMETDLRNDHRVATLKFTPWYKEHKLA